MSNRRKLSAPPAFLSAIPIGVEIQVIDLEVSVPVQREEVEARWEEQEEIRRGTQHVLEEALNSLRLDGASEQQLEAVMGAMRITCLLKILDLDVYNVARQYYESDGATISPNRALAAALVPELKDRVR